MLSVFKSANLLAPAAFAALLVCVFPGQVAHAAEFVSDTRVEMRIEGAFWRLDSTDASGNKAALSSLWALRGSIGYFIPLGGSVGIRPELGGLLGKFESPEIFRITDTTASTLFYGGTFYIKDSEGFSAYELRYARETAFLTKTTGGILSLHQAQTHRAAFRFNFSFLQKYLLSSEKLILGVEVSGLHTSSDAFSAKRFGVGWAVVLRSGMLIFTLGGDSYQNAGLPSRSTQLSIGLDGLRIGF